MGNPIFRFTLRHALPVQTLQFDNNEFAVSITGWDQINSGSDINFSWSNPSAALASGASHNTSAIGQDRPGGWPAGTYTLEIRGTNSSTGGSAPFQSLLNIWGSSAGSSLDTAIVYTGTGTWDVGAGPVVRTVAFTLASAQNYLFFKFTKVGPTSSYNVNFRLDYITLTEIDDALSEPTIISEPDGWKDAKLKLERHPTFHSLVEYFEGSFIFYGENNFDNGGADYIRQIENLYGFDAEIRITVEADIDGDGVYEEEIFVGQLDLTGLQEVKDNKIEVPIIRNDLWSKFISRLDTPIDIRSTTDLDGNAATVIDLVDIHLTSQKLRQKYEGYQEESVTLIYDIPDNQYGQIDFAQERITEIDEKFTLPRLENSSLPSELFAVEYAGAYHFDIQIVTFTGGIPTSATDSNLQVRLQINDDAAIVLTQVGMSGGIDSWVEHVYSNTINLSKGDLVRLYFFNNNATGASYQFNWSANILHESHLIVTADTIFPPTDCQAYLIHDVFAAVIHRITGKNCFYSEYFGSTTTNARQYVSNGDGWKHALAKGIHLRGNTFDEKGFFTSFNDAWQGADPIFNLCLFYDTIDGEEVIRIEPKNEAYQTTPSIFIENIREISREYDHDKIYNQIEVGFEKWKTEEVSGLDDPQTKRVWATVVKKIKNALRIMSKWVAGSNAIEITRRKRLEQSADFRFDDETIFIILNPDDVSPDRFTPELDENFDSISGLLNSSTRYNSIHTPLRMLLRWGNVWNGCLQKYQSSSLKFVSGEGNYDMVSDYDCASGTQSLAVICDSISEKSDISLTTYGSTFGYLHLPLLYNVEIINFTWDDYKLIRDSHNNAISMSQTLDNFKRFFAKELIYELCKGKSKITAWPYDEAPILVVETTQPEDPEEEPDPDECQDVELLFDFDGSLDGWTSEGVEVNDWVYSPKFGGSASIEADTDEGVNNLVVDGITLPQQAHTIDITYARTDSSDDFGLRLRILDASDVELQNDLFATTAPLGLSGTTATIEVTSSSVWTAAAKLEISVVASGFDSVAAFIMEVKVLGCDPVDPSHFEDCYNDILEFGESL